MVDELDGRAGGHDLVLSDGREILRRLIGRADLVVFNKLDPVLERLGLDPAALAQINPDAIAVQLNAYKGERPSSSDDYPGHAPRYRYVFKNAGIELSKVWQPWGRDEAPVTTNHIPSLANRQREWEARRQVQPLQCRWEPPR